MKTVVTQRRRAGSANKEAKRHVGLKTMLLRCTQQHPLSVAVAAPAAVENGPTPFKSRCCRCSAGAGWLGTRGVEQVDSIHKLQPDDGCGQHQQVAQEHIRHCSDKLLCREGASRQQCAGTPPALQADPILCRSNATRRTAAYLQCPPRHCTSCSAQTQLRGRSKGAVIVAGRGSARVC